ncbi:MAG: hypothetical protein C4520_13285 [Candidatus Abyssobacteria bacterium SURF_5]|uniref:Uncharacterized protein n=1 Tax=Abyssobacteria bacterium (strain SURF_5) TaxID=2093360 RepID=A0A3A4NDA8_ABYX5|nr:MAG: hypothetical protein C4520_13285 [Candidatus Abyssubacteria bacterium SURF_5]
MWQVLFARKWAIFFLLWLTVGLSGIALIGCARNSSIIAGQETETQVSAPNAPTAEVIKAVSENPPPAPRRNVRRDVEEVEAELERERINNQALKEENDWLRVQVIHLQQELITANQNIYSLNRKLDAIFKPN